MGVARSISKTRDETSSRGILMSQPKETAFRIIGDISYKLYSDWASRVGADTPVEEFEKMARQSLRAAAAYIDSGGEEMLHMAENFNKFGNLLGKISVEKGL